MDQAMLRSFFTSSSSGAPLSAEATDTVVASLFGEETVEDAHRTVSHQEVAVAIDNLSEKLVVTPFLMKDAFELLRSTE